MRTFAFLVCLTFAVLASTATASTISCYKVEDGYCGQVALSKAVEKEVGGRVYVSLLSESCFFQLRR